jgi:ribosome maturation factor RimP
MVNRAKIEEMVLEQLDESMFLVDVHIKPSRVIQVFIDSFEGLTIDQCATISRHLEQGLDEAREDYELQVSSPGLTEPFKVKEQYLKNVGRQVEVITVEGETFTGTLKEADSGRIILETSTREKVEGHKKKQLIVREHQLSYGDVKSAKVIITFK